MIELGKKQKLTVVKSVDFGVYLGEDIQADAKNRVLLPSRQVPEGTKEGDSIEAFISGSSYCNNKRTEASGRSDSSSESLSGNKDWCIP